MGKSSKDRDRRAIAEQIRREQQSKERRRTIVVMLACLAVGAIIIGFAAVQYLDNRRKENRPVSDIGAAASAADCQPVKRRNAEGSGQHAATGTPIDYPDTPPAYGEHWGNYLMGAEIKNFYSDDRPEVERLVHSLEHGYTILWYDETAAADSATMSDLEALADRFPVGDRLIIAPWTAEDGDAFPDGTPLALTHWTGPSNQQGIWQFCGKVSGDVVSDFMKEFPAGNAPEPGAA